MSLHLVCRPLSPIIQGVPQGSILGPLYITFPLISVNLLNAVFCFYSVIYCYKLFTVIIYCLSPSVVQTLEFLHSFFEVLIWCSHLKKKKSLRYMQTIPKFMFFSDDQKLILKLLCLFLYLCLYLLQSALPSWPCLS